MPSRKNSRVGKRLRRKSAIIRMEELLLKYKALVTKDKDDPILKKIAIHTKVLKNTQRNLDA